MDDTSEAKAARLAKLIAQPDAGRHMAALLLPAGTPPRLIEYATAALLGTNEEENQE